MRGSCETRLSRLPTAQNSFHGFVDGAFAAYDDVGRLFGGEDELHRHRLNGGSVLIENAVGCSATLGDIAVEAAAEAFLFGCLYEDGEVGEGSDFGAVEGEDSFDQDRGRWVDGCDVRRSCMQVEEILRDLDLLSLPQGREMRFEQGPVERIGVVVVPGGAVVQR